jgi:hypothetical protein
MKPPKMEFLNHPVSEEPEGWTTIVSIQTDGTSLAFQFNDQIMEIIDREHAEKLINRLRDGIYTLRPDLRPQ